MCLFASPYQNTLWPFPPHCHLEIKVVLRQWTVLFIIEHSVAPVFNSYTFSQQWFFIPPRNELQKRNNEPFSAGLPCEETQGFIFHSDVWRSLFNQLDPLNVQHVGVIHFFLNPLPTRYYRNTFQSKLHQGLLTLTREQQQIDLTGPVFYIHTLICINFIAFL